MIFMRQIIERQKYQKWYTLVTEIVNSSNLQVTSIYEIYRKSLSMSSDANNVNNRREMETYHSQLYW
jgi:hypothetical protein